MIQKKKMFKNLGIFSYLEKKHQYTGLSDCTLFRYEINIFYFTYLPIYTAMIKYLLVGLTNQPSSTFIFSLLKLHLVPCLMDRKKGRIHNPMCTNKSNEKKTSSFRSLAYFQVHRIWFIWGLRNPDFMNKTETNDLILEYIPILHRGIHARQ